MAFDARSTQRDVAQINITPLVDVMLVLLVIFMVAAPVMSQPIPFDLPRPGGERSAAPPKIDLRIDASGQVSWNGNATPVSALQAMMAAEIERSPQDPPLLQIDADGDSDYGAVAKVLAIARNADMQRIAFVRQ